MATYLDLTNELMREFNEVELTSGNFSTALGVQKHVKDVVNRAYIDMCSEEPQWPFLATGESGGTDPMYGNTYVETVAGTRWYELKPASSSLTTDYGAIDWDNFLLTTVGVSGESAPYTINNIRFTSTEEWKDYLRISQNKDDADTQNWGLPNRVMRSPDARKFGLSPIPDQVYRICFYAWDLPTELDAHGDSTVFPDVFRMVLLSRARYYMWQFKDNAQAASFALDDYKRGLDRMRSDLIEPTPSYFKDDRIGFI